MATATATDREHSGKRAYTAADGRAAERLAYKAGPKPATARDPASAPVSLDVEVVEEERHPGRSDGSAKLVSERHWARRRGPLTWCLGILAVAVLAGMLAWAA